VFRVLAIEDVLSEEGELGEKLVDFTWLFVGHIRGEEGHPLLVAEATQKLDHGPLLLFLRQIMKLLVVRFLEEGLKFGKHSVSELLQVRRVLLLSGHEASVLSDDLLLGFLLKSERLHPQEIIRFSWPDGGYIIYKDIVAVDGWLCWETFVLAVDIVASDVLCILILSVNHRD